MSVSAQDRSARIEEHPLDNAVWAALTGPFHARFAEINGQAARYQTDVAPFTTLATGADEHAWAQLAELVGPGAEVSVVAPDGVALPPGWTVATALPGVQLIDAGVEAVPDEEAVRLGPADVPEMLDLVARTRPGPFLPRTIELGTYLGIRRDGALIAMAGERLHPPGWTEISAVCTDAAYRGQGLGTRLVKAVAAGIRDRGETPFMHAAASNTNAIRLYTSLGFQLRRRPSFSLIRVPGR
jgi:ribosomal protein S18 acetylase RimI-like enzyme